MSADMRDLAAKFEEAERAYKSAEGCATYNARKVYLAAREALLTRADDCLDCMNVDSACVPELVYFCAWALRRQGLI